MNNKLVVGALAATALLTTPLAASAAAFDINEPLSVNGALGAPWVASGTVTPSVINNALRLTSATEAQRGFALYDQAISVTRGIDVTFSQAQWDGDGADGIVFFVKKGDDTSTTPGAAGGSMGYSRAADNDGDSGNGLVPVAGLSGALLGVGLDSYGNFASTDADGTDCSTTFARGGGNAIVLRGAGQGNTGYCLLADSYSLNSNSLSPLSNNYTVREDAARVVRVSIDSATASNPRVKVYYEGTLAFDIPLPSSFNSVSTVKIGFAAGTGGSYNIHEVWGLTSTSAESSSSGGSEDLADTGASDVATVVAVIAGLAAFIAAAVVRPRRRAVK